MKKLFLTLSLTILMNTLSALPTFICTSGGFLFQCTWYYDSQGNLAYYLESEGPGSCTGGPWTMNVVPFSDDLPDTTPLASPEMHDKFAVFNIPVVPDVTAEVLKEAISLTSKENTNSFSFDPNRIHPLWAKSFAISNNLSIYSLKLMEHPLNNSMKFDIWSIKQQTVRISIISLLTGLEVWSSDVEVNKGKNKKTNIHFGNSLSGNYILKLVSDKNVINKNIMIN